MTTQRCVLVIDDSALIRQVAQMMLSAHGWRTLTAETGVEGLAIAARERPDAILLDVIMPDPDGPETLRRLRADPHTAAIPIIFLTGLADAEEGRAELSALGPDGILAKPFDPSTFAALVAGAMGWAA